MESVFDSKEILEIRDESTWERLVDDAEGPVMVEFFVTWCPHCQREAPILDGLAQAIKDSGVALYHSNAEVMYEKGPEYGIEETPSFILVENGELIARHEGFLNADEIIEFSQGLIGRMPEGSKGLGGSSRAFNIF